MVLSTKSEQRTTDPTAGSTKPSPLDSTRSPQMSETPPTVPSQTGPDLRTSQPFALASGQFQGTVFVSGFLATEVRAWIANHPITDDASAVLMTQLLRVDSWLRTLAKLDDPADFQAVAAACRSLLETTIDIALIHGSPQKHEQLLAWEESAKLYHAEHSVTYLLSLIHISEPTRQAEISYAVFCLKKK